jgi:hypothetical protein
MEENGERLFYARVGGNKSGEERREINLPWISEAVLL